MSSNSLNSLAFHGLADRGPPLLEAASLCLASWISLPSHDGLEIQGETREGKKHLHHSRHQGHSKLSIVAAVGNCRYASLSLKAET
jgi:hypothetical protein